VGGSHRVGGGGEIPSTEGIESLRGVCSQWREKCSAIGNLLEKVSSPIWLYFYYWGGDREATEVALKTEEEWKVRGEI
jgi:hypothetical protein